MLAFAGSGKTTALRLLAEADPSPALYIAYNKATQLEVQGRFPAHVACRTVHSQAYRARRIHEQQHRLERRLTGREIAERLAIPALDALRPSFWGQCAIATVRRFTHGTAREIGPEHLPSLPRGTDRADLVVALARQLWAEMREPAGEVPLEHDAYLKLWQLEGARLPAQAALLYLDEAQDANPVTLAILQAQRRPTVWVGDPWQSICRFRRWDELLEEAEEARDPELRFLVSWSPTMALPRRPWSRTCGGGRWRVRRQQSGCCRPRTRPKGWSGHGCGWHRTSRAWTSCTRWTGTGLPGSRPRSATRSCTCST